MDKLHGVVRAAQLGRNPDLNAGLGLEAAAFQFFDARGGHGHAVILLHAGLGQRLLKPCLLYTSDAADDLLCVDLGGRRHHKKKKKDINGVNPTLHTNKK